MRYSNIVSICSTFVRLFGGQPGPGRGQGRYLLWVCYEEAMILTRGLGIEGVLRGDGRFICKGGSRKRSHRLSYPPPSAAGVPPASTIPSLVSLTPMTNTLAISPRYDDSVRHTFLVIKAPNPANQHFPGDCQPERSLRIIFKSLQTPLRNFPPCYSSLSEFPGKIVG